MLALTRRHVAPHRVDVWEAFGTQLVIGRREGYRLWDLDGRELIDLHLNGGTFNLGHRNPEVVEAMVTAASTLDVGNHHFASPARAELAARLAELTPGELAYTVFASGGSEAIDVAIKSARRSTGRRRIVTLAAGYHGRTGLSGAAGADAGAAYFLSDLPDEFTKVPFADVDAIAAELTRGDVAAVLLETVPATYGFPVPPAGYLPAVKALCEEHDALYIADEVQTGLGRTGRMWGVETFGVQPDILVCGKGLSGGMYPIAATVLTPRAGQWLNENGWGHVSTFGGAEIGCRVAERVLEITARPAVRERVAQLIERVGAGLAELRNRQPYLAEVRQSGLVIGLRVDHPDGGIYLQQELYELGVWAIASGFDQSVLQFKPGLLLDDALTDSVLERLELALRRAKEVDRAVPSRHIGAKPSPR
ncbi:MAG: aminotransferase class III-fold pyridoxal phosphate-dependent enzyme [Actinomycetota bacterium]|nr:aminotransferase class III-fold pyridoxal phosphate-dependent enzyme [Actinomycetota bacterium]